ncbi:DUF6844 domain-containing protein [Castellaniella hirudinis]|uniref:DUF6844 domain-containing protein n=1 Tax=Castellaniella hirudinis TaxID=1144617 RepID=UPI0039C32D20
MFKPSPLVAALCLLAAQASFAQDAAPDTPAQAQPATLAQAGDISAPVAQAPEALLEQATSADALPSAPAQSYADWVAAFEKEFGQTMSTAKDGKVFYAGMATISADSAADPHYGSQLALAYERALFDLQADYILQNYGRLRSEAVRTVFENQSSDKDAIDPLELNQALAAGGGRLEALFDKALTLVDKKLDNALVEEGVPAEDIQKMSVEQKKNLYKDNFNKKVIKSAYQNMQGLVPVKTRIFPVEANGKKTMAVAVIAVQSEKTRQFARDIARKRPTLVKGNPKSLNDILPADQAGYLNEIGLRYVYDESGRPMLLAYGRTSVPMDPGWSASRALRAQQNAQGVAQAMAEANIIEFMNTNVQVSTSAEIGDISEEWAKQITDITNGKPGDVRQLKENIRETTQTFFKSGKASAAGDLRGTSVLKRWEQKDDNGVVHVGTVVGWTYGQLDNANAIDAQKRGQAQGAQATGAAAGGVSDQSRQSKAVNTKDDF